MRRLSSLDTLRAFVMLLGIVYHAVQFAQAGRGEAGRSELLDGFIYFTHGWRMPVFFLLSGFFTELLIEKYGILETAKNRFRRIGLPFLLALVFILPLNVYFITAYVDLSQGSARNVFSLDFLMATWEHRLRKPKIHHLWFLYYLLGFLVLWFSLRVTPFLKRAAAAIPFFSLAGLYASLLFMRNPMNVDAPDRPIYSGPEFFFYFSLFALGAWSFFFFRRSHRMPLPNLRWSLAIAAAAHLLLYLFHRHADLFTAASLTMLTAIEAAVKALSVIFSCTTLITLFLRYAERESPLVRFLVLASFWTYLVHEPLINAWGTLFQSYTWPLGAEIFVTSTLTFAISFLSYAYLVRGTWLDRLLNGPGTVRRK